MKHGRAGPPRPPPRTQAGHERRATIHDLPGHVLAHRVAAHLSAADAARLMQAAGRVHRGELGRVMGQKKEEVQRYAAPIVAAMHRVEKGEKEIKFEIPGFKIAIEKISFNHDCVTVSLIPTRQPKKEEFVMAFLEMGAATTYEAPDISYTVYIPFYLSTNVAHLWIEINKSWKTVGLDARDMASALLTEVARQFSKKPIVKEMVWGKGGDSRSRLQRNGEAVLFGEGEDLVRLVKKKEAENPGKLILVVTGKR